DVVLDRVAGDLLPQLRQEQIPQGRFRGRHRLHGQPDEHFRGRERLFRSAGQGAGRQDGQAEERSGHGRPPASKEKTDAAIRFSTDRAAGTVGRGPPCDGPGLVTEKTPRGRRLSAKISLADYSREVVRARASLALVHPTSVDLLSPRHFS